MEEESGSVGIRELRQSASKVLARVKKGERITVTERGRRIAYLAPAVGAVGRLDELEAQGLLVRARNDLLLTPPLRRRRRLTKQLESLRRDER